MIVAKFPHAPNSQPQTHPPDHWTGLQSGARLRAHSVAQIHILFNLHRSCLITWPAGNLYPCVGVMGSGVVAAAAMMLGEAARYFVVVVGWVLEAVEIIPRPSAKRSNTTVGSPCRYPLDALTCRRKHAGHGRHLAFRSPRSDSKVYSALGPLPRCLNILALAVSSPVAIRTDACQSGAYADRAECRPIHSN